MKSVIRVTATNNEKVIIPVGSISHIYGNTVVLKTKSDTNNKQIKYVVRETNDQIWAQIQ